MGIKKKDRKKINKLNRKKSKKKIVKHKSPLTHESHSPSPQSGEANKRILGRNGHLN